MPKLACPEIRWATTRGIRTVMTMKMIAPPTTKLSDAQDLQYRVTIDVPAAGEHTIAVRVTDAYDNQSAEKVIVK